MHEQISPSLATTPHILALDIGPQSIGWALLRAQQDEEGGWEPTAIVRTGVRVFEAGVEGDIEQGKDVSRAVDRRTARLARRRLDRLARRLNALHAILRRAGLLPQMNLPPHPAAPASRKRTAGERREYRMALAQARDRSLAEMDKVLTKKWQERLRLEGAPPERIALVPHTLPYLLRARALDEPLSPHELGRALYHLGQRRGFLSNRKSAPKQDEDLGKVKGDIAKLAQEIQQSGARTLGEFFASCNPHEQRIRNRWTGREMYAHEFEEIWKKQQQHHPGLLTEDLEKSLRRAIFHQRPLRIRKEFLGNCECEKGRKRAPLALLAAQRFRLLQMVNNTRVKSNGHERPLTADERARLIAALERDGDLEFSKARKLLGLARTDKFNFEEGGEKRFLGNRTAAKLRAIFGDRWDQFTDAERDAVVADWLSIQKDWVLEKRGRTRWGLDSQKAKEFGALQLEDGYCRLSRQALAKLLPRMEAGEHYATARFAVYGSDYAGRPLDELPPVLKALPELRNPAVSRALTELRKVVNAILRRYGKPAVVRIELGRDLRNSRDKRVKIWKKNRENEKARERAARKILDETGNANPSRADIEKVLLFWECNGVCPYTGKHIPFSNLFSPNPQFDVEHIIPFSRSLDNSFLNKTLCDVEENRTRKGNRTPWEAYHGDPQRWSEILDRVRQFTGEAAREKLRRFQLERVDSVDDFASFQLNDTRYATKLAKAYIGRLYGDEAPRRVQASRGQITAILRNELRLNSILGDGGEKNREDHRHHAVDAIAIALSDRKIVKMLSDAAARAWQERRRRFAPIQPPFEGFLDAARQSIADIIVSHRVSKKISGPLHEDSIYGKERLDENGQPCIHIRKPLKDLKQADQIEAIVDPRIRDIVRAKLEELGGDLKKFENPENHPYLVTKTGDRIPIHKVRIRDRRSVVSIGRGPSERRVWLRNNHHVEIIEVRDKKGTPRWEGRMVTLFEAVRRMKAGEPVVCRDHGEGTRFVFSLAHEEVVLLKTDSNAQPELWLVSKFSEDVKGNINITFRRLWDARLASDLQKIKGGYLRKTPNSLRDCEPRKVAVTPLGDVRWAND